MKGPSSVAIQKSAAPTIGRAPVGVLQRQCACGQHTGEEECGDCKKNKMGLQRHSIGSAGSDTAPPLVHEVLRSPGRPLDTSARAFFEPRFGHDFSRVRIHTDSVAAQSAADVAAHAWTVGSDIAFGSGRYSPFTPFGAGLLAHELTHVVQQSGASGSRAELRIGRSDDAYEREADRQARAMTTSSAARPLSASMARLQRSVKSGLLDVLLFIPRLFGLEVFPAEDLVDYLKVLKKQKGPENGIFSDNKARACVNREREFGPYDTQTKTWLIQEMLGGHTSFLDEGAIITLLRRSQTDRSQIVSAVSRDLLWSKFSGGNRRAVEAMTLTAADAGTALESRLRSLDPSEINEYAANATDPKVLESVRRALALSRMTAPVPTEATITPGGDANLTINGVRVIVHQDRINPSVGNHAFTHGEFHWNGPATVAVTPQNANQPLGMTVTPVDVSITIWTDFASEEQKQGRSGYGVGTRPQDQPTLRFHERAHGEGWLNFLRNNAPPAFTGTSSMQPAQFNAAVEQWNKAMQAYGRRASDYSREAGDCVGTLPTDAQLEGTDFTAATICHQG